MKKKKKTNKPSSSSNPINVSDSSTFHVSIAATAVSQICHSIGFKSTHTTALQTLTDITVRYLASLATASATSACSTGRTECNLYDVIRGLEDVHADVGFKGSSAVGSSLTDSEMMKDLIRFVEWSREIPFAKPLHTVPRGKEMVTSLNGESNGKSEVEEVPRGKEMVTSLCENEKVNGEESYCGEKEAVNVGKNGVEKEKKVPRGKRKRGITEVNEGEVVPRGKQMVTSLCEYEKVNGKESYRGEKEAVGEGKNGGEREKKVPRGRQKRVGITEVNEGEVVPRGKEVVTSLYGKLKENEKLNGRNYCGEMMPRGKCEKSEMCHVPKWLPDFPSKKDVFTGEVNEGKKSETEKEGKVNYYNKEASELAEVRKKVSFEIVDKSRKGKTRRGKDVIKVKVGGVDLRKGVCKGGKRILCQIYQDYNDLVKNSMVKMKYARR